jgi:endo-1,4-beta-xylanase
MMKMIRVRIDDITGRPAPAHIVKTLYASDMDFEPDDRRLAIGPEGIAELDISDRPYMLHVKMPLPMYGNIWVMAHNQGKGYDGEFVDFVTEAIRSYIWEAERFAEGITLSVTAKGHLEAAKEYAHLADRGNDTAENRMYALSHAIYAAEAALFERSAKKLDEKPRPDLLLGCNMNKFSTPGSRYGKFYKQLFNCATLPFYSGRTVPQRGVYTYQHIDRCLAYCEENGIKAKGHPLWFGHKEVNPGWMFDLDFDGLKEAAREMITHHVESYKGRVTIWDAMNEAHDWANCFELSQEQLLELTAVCCETLRKCDPNSTSIVNICLPFAEYVAGRYNCYGSLPERLISPYAYLKKVIEMGVDFDVVGIQLYFPARDLVAVSRMLDTFSKLGKPIHITEMGVNGGTRSGAAAGGSSWSQLSMSEGSWHGGWSEHTQADWMEQFYTIAAARRISARWSGGISSSHHSPSMASTFMKKTSMPPQPPQPWS